MSQFRILQDKINIAVEKIWDKYNTVQYSTMTTLLPSVNTV